MPTLTPDMQSLIALLTVGLLLSFLTFPMANFLIKIGAVIKRAIVNVYL